MSLRRSTRAVRKPIRLAQDISWLDDEWKILDESETEELYQDGDGAFCDTAGAYYDDGWRSNECDEDDDPDYTCKRKRDSDESESSDDESGSETKRARTRSYSSTDDETSDGETNDDSDDGSSSDENSSEDGESLSENEELEDLIKGETRFNKMIERLNERRSAPIVINGDEEEVLTLIEEFEKEDGKKFTVSDSESITTSEWSDTETESSDTDSE